MEGTPAEPPMARFAVPNWSPGDTIPFGYKTLRLVGIRDDDLEGLPIRRIISG
jgi:hypothetical protein